MKEKCFIFLRGDKEADDGMKFFLVPEQFEFYTASEEINISEVEVDFELPVDLSKDEIRMKAINTLKAKQAKISLDAEVRREFLQKRIDVLSRLEYVPMEN